MRALAAYLTVILCCGFYKDKQLPAYLSLKSSSISAFCKIFSAKNPYPITARTEMGLRKPPRHRSVPPASPNTSGPTGASNPSGMTHRIKKKLQLSFAILPIHSILRKERSPKGESFARRQPHQSARIL